ncbi:MAG: hypothetical protein CL661_03790 [Bacteroidetes bacterium]|jgi:hypothetical protein|nr:hypothetical protein [Bacteroidota bacterium]|tara:strand:+ start:212 stop:469 length:258 start_codon:yes stop_codon:yes gene_type:complete
MVSRIWKMMKKIMHILFLSCLKATELLEKKLYFKLSLKEKLQLRMHKSMCEACSNYQKQSILIEKAIAKQENLENQKLEIDVDSL